ncbi:1-deoxy-D-xylulose-5-phosphate reductoisomerase [Actinoalloteichus spitiensis]|uniref:1-deoxy-D-xylulose-5-phosphate reductoisomerase n=1 Tax=Actinoalloteichus spitiensis TaxID=252394 RepID=UPI000362B686|nr:1-deoxy-D-xylulose-5-phosphate reductoisomerase [Actinoalloteichus spitiensis]
MSSLPPTSTTTEPGPRPAPAGNPSSARRVLLLGSTGSVGTQTLDVARRNPDAVRVVGLAAGGANLAALVAQAHDFQVEAIAVPRAGVEPELLAAWRAEAERRGLPAGTAPPRVHTGVRALLELVESTPSDIVLNAITGSRGLEPTLAALATGATLALANKESLIAGGPLVLAAAAPGQIVPVDSEHSALAQCLRGGRADEVDRLVLTASGGPFHSRSREDLDEVTVEEALAHPTWSMGPVVSVNSATLVNKGLELIEAHLLFGVPYDRIDVVVHRTSVVHSMVTFVDGSTLVQASPPDMRLPIGVALGWPRRLPNVSAPCRFDTTTTWTFEPVDNLRFPAVELARAAGRAGGSMPAVYNAANEEAVDAFLEGRTKFTRILETVERVLAEADEWRRDPSGVDDVLAAEDWARARSRRLLGVTGHAAGSVGKD